MRLLTEKNRTNLIFTLVAVLATNVVLRHYIFEEDILSKILTKVILILITLLLLFKARFIYYIKPIIKNTLSFLIISVILIVISFNYINILIDNSGNVLNSKIHFEFLIYCLTIGVFEELFFRVYIYHYLHNICQKKEKNLIQIILITSLIFGLAHISNIFNPEYIKATVINQILLAFSIGILLQSIYIRTKSIILVIAIHSLIDYFGMFKRYLLKENSTTISDTYTFDDFITTFISLLIITLIFIIPVSYSLIKRKIKKYNNI